MHLTLHVWRQRGPGLPGDFVRYAMTDVSPDMSFLEMLDVLNQQLLARKDEPIAFDHDCREGICGMCGMVINGRPHGPQRATTTCQLHMRSFPDRAELWIEPWRAGAWGCSGGGGPGRTGAWSKWSRGVTRRGSGRAPTTGNAGPRAPRRSRSTSAGS